MIILVIHLVYYGNTGGVLVWRRVVHEVYYVSETDTRRVLVRALFCPRLIHSLYTLKVCHRHARFFGVFFETAPVFFFGILLFVLAALVAARTNCHPLMIMEVKYRRCVLILLFCFLELGTVRATYIPNIVRPAAKEIKAIFRQGVSIDHAADWYWSQHPRLKMYEIARARNSVRYSAMHSPQVRLASANGRSNTGWPHQLARQRTNVIRLDAARGGVSASGSFWASTNCEQKAREFSLGSGLRYCLTIK